MQPKIYKLGEDFLSTNASERQLTAIIEAMKTIYGIDCYNIYDLINELDKRGFLAEFYYINTNIEW